MEIGGRGEAWRVPLTRLGDVKPRDGRFTPVLLRFLTQTITHLANDHIRTHTRRRLKHSAVGRDGDSALDGDPLDRLQAKDSRVSAKLVRDETVQKVKECIATLSPRDQEVVDLRAIAGLSNKDAARRLDEDENTVAQRYRRARARLITLLPGSVFEEIEDP